MPRLLIRTNAAVEDCEKHLQATSAVGTEIESYLTQYLVVILCADVQQEIYRLSEERAALLADTGISAFVSAGSRKLLRSIKKGEIVGYIAMFGAECKDKLNSQLTEPEVSMYNNAVGDRHDVAHRLGASISFGDLKSAVVVAEKILRAAAYSLGLAPPLTPLAALPVSPPDPTPDA
jgi:hypothetical protein